VYDIKDRRAYFRTQAARDVRWIDMDGLAFDCNTPVSMLDINAKLTGDTAKSFQPYTSAANLQLVRGSFAKTPFLSDTSPDLRDELANYPEATTCGAQAGTSGGK
jgi:hypothetical protein